MYEREGGEGYTAHAVVGAKTGKNSPKSSYFVRKTVKTEQLQNYGIPPRQLKSDPFFLILH